MGDRGKGWVKPEEEGGSPSVSCAQEVWVQHCSEAAWTPASLAVERRRVSGAKMIHAGGKCWDAAVSTHQIQIGHRSFPPPLCKLSPHSSPCPCIKREQMISEQEHGKGMTRILLDSGSVHTCAYHHGQFSELHLPSITHQRETQEGC